MNGTRDIAHRKPIGLHLHHVDVDLDLAFQCADDVHFLDLFQAFEPVLRVVGKTLQFGKVVVAADVHLHDREVREVDVHDLRIVLEILWKVLFGAIYSVLDLLLGIVGVNVGVELDDDVAIVLQRIALYLLNAGDTLAFFLDRADDQVFHVLGRSAGINHADIDVGQRDVRETFLWKVLIGDEARDGQDQRDDEGRDPVIDGPTGGLEFLLDFFFHCRRGKRVGRK